MIYWLIFQIFYQVFRLRFLKGNRMEIEDNFFKLVSVDSGKEIKFILNEVVILRVSI